MEKKKDGWFSKLFTSPGHEREDSFAQRKVRISASKDASLMRAEASVLINRPLADVYAFFSDPENNASWISGVLKCEGDPRGVVKERGRLAVEMQFIGRHFRTTAIFTEVLHNKKLAYQGERGPFPYRGTLEFVETPQGTLVAVNFEAVPGEVLHLTLPLLRLAVQTKISSDLTRVKEILESS